MFQVNDLVKHHGRLGKVLETKLINLSWTRYVLYRVEFSQDEPIEWINGSYLVKA